MLPQIAWIRVGLERVNGVHEAAWGVAYLIGPGVGGVLIAWVGAAGALWATAVGFVVSAVLIAFVRVSGVGKPSAEDRPENLWVGAKEGLAFVWNDRLLKVLAILTMVLVAVYMPVEGVVLPVIFESQQQPARLGFVLMALSAGGIVGSLLYGLLAERIRRSTAMIGSMIGAAASLLAMSVLPAYPLLVVAGACAGFFWGPVGPLTNLAMQTHAARPCVEGSWAC